MGDVAYVSNEICPRRGIELSDKSRILIAAASRPRSDLLGAVVIILMSDVWMWPV